MVKLKLKQMSVFLPLVVIILTGFMSAYWLTNKPRAERKTIDALPPVVETLFPELVEHSVTIHAMGNVMASQSVNLNARVSGMVVSVSKNFIEGGFLKKGEPIVELDPIDFELAVEQRRADLEKAKFSLTMEMGQQVIAKKEYELLGGELNAQAQEMVLRKPHLNVAKAAVKAAEAALAQAELELSRTKPVSPFNAIVEERNANLGSWVNTFSTGTPLVKLVATDQFWIEVSIPVKRLSWIAIPEINSTRGAQVKVTYEQAWGKNKYRRGVVKRLKAGVESEGRMAKLIVEVNDPFSQRPENAGEPPLMLGTLVSVEITGKRLSNVYRLPESSVHDGHEIWLKSTEGTLAIMDVESVWAEDGSVFLSKEQLPDNPEVVISGLSTPVNGMRLRSPSQKRTEVSAAKNI
jgi:RND family efflux transporter MFP subunit